MVPGSGVLVSSVNESAFCVKDFQILRSMLFVKNLVSRDKSNVLKLNCKELNLPGKSEYRHILEGMLT